MEKMSRHQVPLNPAFLPPATHGVLKSLLENPMKLPLHHEGNGSRDRATTTVSAPRGGTALRGVKCAECARCECGGCGRTCTNFSGRDQAAAERVLASGDICL